MSNVDYDLVIIGGGPGGLTAGLYASRARLNVLLLEKELPGGQMAITDWVENYPGFPEGISGMDLSEKMKDQALKFDLKFDYGEVESLDLTGDTKVIKLAGKENKEITTHTIIISSGASPRMLGVGDEELKGKGVSTCATCDAPFYRDKVVVAVGGGDTAVQESIFLTKFAKKVYLVHRRDELRATKILQERALANDKIEFVWDSVVTGFGADLFKGVEKVFVENVKSGEKQTIEADGCFVWIGIEPTTGFLGNSVELNDWGFIKADGNMETSVPGVYAVGDVRDTPLRQITTAVGDGAIAAIMAEHYIENLKK